MPTEEEEDEEDLLRLGQPGAGFSNAFATAPAPSAEGAGMPFGEPSPVQFGKAGSPELRQEWDGFLANPNTQAALIQFGIALMQPLGVGQNALGHVGQALGQAGAAVGRRGEMDVKERALESREDTAAERLRLAQERLDLTRERDAGRTKPGEVSRTAIFQRAQSYQKELEARLNKRADEAEKKANDILPSPLWKKYKDKTAEEIKQDPEFRRPIIEGYRKELPEADRHLMDQAGRINTGGGGAASTTPTTPRAASPSPFDAASGSAPQRATAGPQLAPVRKGIPPIDQMKVGEVYSVEGKHYRWDPSRQRLVPAR